MREKFLQGLTQALGFTLTFMLSFWAVAQTGQTQTTVNPTLRGQAQIEGSQAYGHLALVTESGLTVSRAMRQNMGGNFGPLVPFDPNNPETFLPQPAYEALNESLDLLVNYEYQKAQIQIFNGLRFYLKQPQNFEDYQAMRTAFFTKPLTDIFKTNLLPKIQYQNLTDLLGMWALVLVHEGSHSLAAQLLTQILSMRESQVGLGSSDIWLMNNFAVAASRLGGYAQARELFDKATAPAAKGDRMQNFIEMAVFYNNIAMLAPLEFIDDSFDLLSRALTLASRASAPSPLMLDLRLNLNTLMRRKGMQTAPDGLNMTFSPEYAQNSDFISYYQFLAAKEIIFAGIKEGVPAILQQSKSYFSQVNRADVMVEILKTEINFWRTQNEKGKTMALQNELRTLLNTQFSASHPELIEIQAQIALSAPLASAPAEFNTYFNLVDQHLNRHFLFLPLSEQSVFLQKRHRELSEILASIEKNPTAYQKILPSLFMTIAQLEGFYVNSLNAKKYLPLSSSDLKTKEVFYAWLDAGELFAASVALPKIANPDASPELQNVLLQQKLERVQSLPNSFDPLKNIKNLSFESVKKQLQNGEAVLMSYRFAKAKDSSYCMFYLTQEAAAPQLFFLKNFDKEASLDALKLYGSFSAKLAGRARIFFLACGAFLSANPYWLKDIGTKYNLSMVSGIDKIGNWPSAAKGSRVVYFHQSAPNQATQKMTNAIRAQYPVTLSFGPSQNTEADFQSFADSSEVVILEGQALLGEKFGSLLLNSAVVMAENPLPLPLGAGTADGLINPFEILMASNSAKVFVINLDNIPSRYNSQSLMELARACTQAGADYCLINTQNSTYQLRHNFLQVFLTSVKTKQPFLAFLEADRSVKGSGFILIK
jgi:hypothetical protein